MLGNFQKKLALQLKVFTIFTGPAATADQAASPRHRADQPTVSPQSARHFASQPANHSQPQSSPAQPANSFWYFPYKSIAGFWKFYEIVWGSTTKNKTYKKNSIKPSSQLTPPKRPAQPAQSVQSVKQAASQHSEPQCSPAQPVRFLWFLCFLYGHRQPANQAATQP